MEIGIDSFAAIVPDPATGRLPSPTVRMPELIEEVVLADRVELGIGEHHRGQFLDSAPAVILAAAAARTNRIRLTSAVTVLSAADPARVFQEFATLDLISRGRAEIVVGRGSFVEAYPLFGLDTRDHDDLFAEKLDLLLALGETTNITWDGRFRASLKKQGVFPRPHQLRLPVWIGVGGTPQSFARAGALGLPLMVAINGGNFERFRPLVDLYKEAGKRAGHSPDALRVGIRAMGLIGETNAATGDAFFPGWAHLTSKIGRERGWSPPTRQQFDAMAGPEGAFLVGDPQTVATKMMQASKILGGIHRITFQMSTASLDTMAMRRSIEHLCTEVAPIVRAARRIWSSLNVKQEERVDIEDLRTFVEVADTGGVSPASRRLGISKSMVSRRLARIESELGVQLLARTTRGAGLTEAGVTFREFAAKTCRDIEIARETILPDGDLRGRLRVAVPLTSGPMYFAPVLAEMASHHPRLQIHAEYSDRFVDLVADGFDCAIRVGLLPDSNLISRRVGEIYGKLVASPAYIRRNGLPETPGGIAAHQALIGAEAWRFTEGDRIVTVQPQGRFSSDNGAALASAAAAGLGLAWLPDCVTHEYLASGALVPVMTRFPLPVGTVYVVRPSSPHPARKVRILCEFLIASFEKGRHPNASVNGVPETNVPDA